MPLPGPQDAAKCDRTVPGDCAIEDLEHVLGYQWTHPLEIFNERWHSIYHMIFATDHEAGNRIMTSLYTNAANEFPAMRQAWLDGAEQRLAGEEAGIQNLFASADHFMVPVARNERLYVHSPPWVPFGTVE